VGDSGIFCYPENVRQAGKVAEQKKIIMEAAMFFSTKNSSVENQDLPAQVAEEAERLYRSGKMHCAEAVLAAVKQTFAPQIPDQVVQLAGGFGGGSGAGCICGAVSGGTMALGLVMNGDKKTVAAMTKELHLWFKETYGATCCKILTAHGKSGCVNLTTRVAGKVAELLLGRGVLPAPPQD
jgi:C_GCAxxG_C_C family probable redox protein